VDPDEIIIRNSKEHDEKWGWLLDAYKTAELYDFDQDRWDANMRNIDEYLMNQQANQGRWGIEKKVSIGDVIIVLSILIVAASDHFDVQTLKERFKDLEVIVASHTTEINKNATDIAVINAKQRP
jgi:hypothetical protein